LNAFACPRFSDEADAYWRGHWIRSIKGKRPEGEAPSCLDGGSSCPRILYRSFSTAWIFVKPQNRVSHLVIRTSLIGLIERLLPQAVLAGRNRRHHRRDSPESPWPSRLPAVPSTIQRQCEQSLKAISAPDTADFGFRIGLSAWLGPEERPCGRTLPLALRPRTPDGRCWSKICFWPRTEADATGFLSRWLLLWRSLW
jgi:hypothetical protein